MKQTRFKKENDKRKHTSVWVWCKTVPIDINISPKENNKLNRKKDLYRKEAIKPKYGKKVACPDCGHKFYPKIVDCEFLFGGPSCFHLQIPPHKKKIKKEI